MIDRTTPTGTKVIYAVLILLFVAAIAGAGVIEHRLQPLPAPVRSGR